ncbi:glycogen operon protein [Gellertiella hungarica]|uniref:Glycogen operon protein n=1 Tax=Gellertiella hungarica TaxID=1572859 RepID=A0A7W6J1H2_9HYPH|nr:glycogen operon protein [Gellertiella hungarica]
MPGLREGQRYGFRAEGVFDPDRGLWFDPAKLLVDPYATELDRPFCHDPRLCRFGEETADLVPRAVLKQHAPLRTQTPRFDPAGPIYEVAVKPFTILHPDIPAEQRGTVRALGHPAVLSHLKKLGVSAVELMPITAWIDERHLPPLGLANGWGYNPVALMALDPRLVPGGVAELRETVEILHAEGIAVILDLVFNHTGESDRYGATLSLRGLDNRTAYRHLQDDPGFLVNDTGCGNTLACDHPVMRRLILDTLRHFVRHAGVDGFRFDLAPVLFRTGQGFDPNVIMARELLADPVLADRILIAEPWDIGPGGYQLGQFPDRFLEWNDRARDRLRRIWRGDRGMRGDLATVLSGSSDVFSGERARGVTFIAAHDGFTLADLVAHAHKHNEANGEDNRDGHDDNHSWNNGMEGKTADPAIRAARRQDVKALLSTLFACRGAIMLTAGDEFGRTQQGNNNAYAQDNAITWLDWQTADGALLAHAAFLARIRRRFSVFSGTDFFHGQGDVRWLSSEGRPLEDREWQDHASSCLVMVLTSEDRERGAPVQLAILFNPEQNPQDFRLPEGSWLRLDEEAGDPISHRIALAPRSVEFLVGNFASG